jgi:hypothetical protein
VDLVAGTVAEVLHRTGHAALPPVTDHDAARPPGERPG